MKKYTQKGFTLVELMIAITLSLILTLFITGFYFANRTTFKSIDNSHQIQYNAQFVFDSLTKDIRSAGYMGCSTDSNFYNALSTQATDTWSNLRTPIQGYGGTTFEAAMVGAKANTNAIVVTSADMERSTSIKFHSPTNTASQFLLNSNPFLSGEKVIISDCASSTIFKIDSVSASTITYNSNGNCVPSGATVPVLGSSCNSVVPRSYAFSPGALINGLRVRGYFIAPSVSDATKNSLYLVDYIKGTGKQELAENVDDMVINYGLDTDNDGVVNQFVKYTAVTDWTKVVSVEIELLFRSNDPNINVTNQSYYLDGVLKTSTDKNLYRSYKTYIAIRNKTT